MALEQTTYIWDVESKICKKINVASEEEEASLYFVSAVCWDNEGHLVATGDNKGHLKVKASSTIYKKKNRKLLIMFTKYIHVYTMPREDVWSNLKRKNKNQNTCIFPIPSLFCEGAYRILYIYKA